MWKQRILEVTPFVATIIGKTPDAVPWATRLVELAIVGVVSSYGTIKTLENDVGILKQQLARNEQMDSEYRASAARQRQEDDRKWDGRIQRLENCFILRNCGINPETRDHTTHGD